MNATILSPTAAVTEFFAMRGDRMVLASEIEEALAEIGNPDAQLPITKTTESVDDFRANGWQDYTRESGIITLRKQTGTHRTARGMKPSYTYANIADCGEYRLVYVERP